MMRTVSDYIKTGMSIYLKIGVLGLRFKGMGEGPKNNGRWIGYV